MFQLILSQVSYHYFWFPLVCTYTNLSVQSGIDVNATDSSKYTPLAWAAAWADKKDTIFLTALAEHPDIQLNKQDDEGYTALGRAAELGRWEAVVYLTYLKGIDVNLCGSDDMTPLLCAAGSGHRGVVNRSFIKLFYCFLLLLSSILNCKGVNVNCSSALTGYSPLIWASEMRQNILVDFYNSNCAFPMKLKN